MRTGSFVFVGGLALVAAATVTGLVMLRASGARFESDERMEVARLDEERRLHAAGLSESARLTADIDRLLREIASRDAVAASAPPPARLAPAALPAAPVPDNPWPHAGRREPLATFQSVQWAIYGGDVDALESLLVLDAAARAEAKDFFDRLDTESQAEFGTPERLLASAVAAKSRTGIEEASLMAMAATADGVMSARLRIAGPRVKPREITLQFQSTPDGWRLLVPAKVVTGYRNLLLGPIVDPYTQQYIR